MYANSLARREDFLYEIHAAGLGHAQTGRTGDCDMQRILANDFLGCTQHFACFFAYFGEVTLVSFIDDLTGAHRDQFDRCGTDIDSEISSGVHKSLPVRSIDQLERFSHTFCTCPNEIRVCKRIYSWYNFQFSKSI